jgi:adhesin transport system outer membrane protein
MGAGIATLLMASPLFAADLPDAVGQALDYRPDLRRQGALAEAAAAAVDRALADYLPRIDLTLSTGWQFTENTTTRAGDGPTGVNQWTKLGTLEGSQLVFDGFGTPYRIDQARAELGAVRAEGRQLAEMIAIDAVQAYIDVQRNQAFVAIASTNLEVHRRLLAQVRVQAAAGQVTDADVAQARARAAFAEATLAERLGGLAAAIAVYVERVGGAPEDLAEVDVPNGLRPAGEGDAVALALEQHPSLAIGRATVAGSTAEVGVAESRYWPELDLVARGALQDDIDGIEGSGGRAEAGAELSWNLYAGGGDQAAIERAEARLAASGYELDERARVVREDVAVAYRELLAAEAVLPPLRDHAEAARQVFAGYRQQFDIGRRSLLDLLDAQGELFTAEVRAADARYRLLLAHYQLAYSMGGLTRALGVTPPE